MSTIDETFDEEAYLRRFKRTCAGCGVTKWTQYFHGDDELCAPCRHEKRAKVGKSDPVKEAFFAGWNYGFTDGGLDAGGLICTPTVELAWEDFVRTESRVA